MKKDVIIAFAALATSLAVYAGVGNKKTKTECCDKTECCPNGTETENCCDQTCE